MRVYTYMLHIYRLPHTHHTNMSHIIHTYLPHYGCPPRKNIYKQTEIFPIQLPMLDAKIFIIKIIEVARG